VPTLDRLCIGGPPSTPYVVLLPGLPEVPNVSVLEHRDEAGVVMMGAVVHKTEGVVSLADLHATVGHAVDWRRLTDAVTALHPGCPVVGCERGLELEAAQDAG
jgi:hypothetical protein